jgi:hypothetical protein
MTKGVKRMNKQLEEFNATVEFKIVVKKTFSVTIKAWQFDGKWAWNVYANIFEAHELFNNPGSAMDSLPFHCGCTYDKLKSVGVTGGNKYDNSGSRKVLVLGSDYMHLHDDYDNHPSPFDRIPYNVLNDAKELVEALNQGDSK